MQIHYSAKHGDLDGVRRCLNRGTEVDAREPSGMTALHFSCGSSEAGVDLVAMLLDAGADIDAVPSVDASPIRLATRANDPDKLQYLITRGASLRPTPSGYTPLIDAISCRGQNNLVEILLSAGVDAGTESSYGESALSVASHIARFDVVRLLLERGVDPAPLKWDSLMRAIVLDDPHVAIQAVMKHSGRLGAKDRWERTCLLLALHRGEMSIIEALARHGADVRIERARCGHTALMHAVIADRTAVVEWCLAQGADPNATNDFGETALMVAARLGSVGCVRTLLAAGAHLDTQSNCGDMAITESANPATVGVLVEAGADIDAVNGSGYGLLKNAAGAGDLSFTVSLLSAGADTEATSTGDTALHMATAHDELAIMQALLDHDAEVNALDVDGWTPLFMAQSIEAVQLLLSHGADSAITDLAGDVARRWIEERNVDAAQLLPT